MSTTSIPQPTPKFVEPASEEEELLALKRIQEEQDAMMNYTPLPILQKPVPPTPEEQKDIDSRSVYIGNVDWNSTEKDVEGIFRGCGIIKRITIPKCRMTGRAKGLAYAEFEDLEGKENALLMDGSILRGRPVKIMQKRTNVPGMRAVSGAQKPQRQQVVVKYVYQAKPRNFLPAGSRKIDRRFTPY